MAKCVNPLCENEAKDRQGALTCSLKCKNTVNNVKRREIDKKLSADFNVLRKNFVILKNLLGANKNTHFTLKLLRTEGFVGGGLAQRVKDIEDGKVYNKIGDIGYRYSDNKEYVLIKRIEDELH